MPLNNKLAAVQPNSDDGEQFWRKFVANWMIWNHIRTVACIIASVSFIIALTKF